MFESQPNFHVTAGLYLPDESRFPSPWPAVIVLCGHSDDGKASRGYQFGAAQSELNGLAALIVDPIGQGERLQVRDQQGNVGVAATSQEHTLLGTATIPIGWSTARWMIHDAMAAIDYPAVPPRYPR